jgi:ribonuclease BN (tRNA processing enzyme)
LHASDFNEVRREHVRDRRPPTVHVTEVEEGLSWSARASAEARLRVSLRGGGRSVVVSGDTRPCENLIAWSSGVDCLIHECCDMTKTSWYPECGWPTIEDKIRDLQSYHTSAASPPLCA